MMLAILQLLNMGGGGISEKLTRFELSEAPASTLSLRGREPTRHTATAGKPTRFELRNRGGG